MISAANSRGDINAFCGGSPVTSTLSPRATQERTQPGAQIGLFCQSEVSLIHCSVSGADRWTVVNAADGASTSPANAQLTANRR
jgi:hypothetical protein